VLSGTIASTATCQLTATYDSPGLIVPEPSGFFEFKNADELAALWAEYGDPEVAEWDDEEMPRARWPRSVLAGRAEAIEERRFRARTDCLRVIATSEH
jgi:hypothetical protein